MLPACYNVAIIRKVWFLAMRRVFLSVAAVCLCFGMLLYVGGYWPFNEGGASDSHAQESGSTVDSAAKIRMGVVPFGLEVAEFIKTAMKEIGCEIEIVTFDSAIIPVGAMLNGEVDVVFANHKPWMEAYAKKNGVGLTMVEPYFYYSPFCLYSTKHKSYEDLPQNATLAMPNDPTNMDRSLRMMGEMGLVTLREKTGDYYTVADIKDNPKGIRIVESDLAATVRNMGDVDGAFSFALFIHQTGILGVKDFLYEDPLAKDFPMGFIIKKGEAVPQWAVDGMKLLNTPAYQERFDEQFKGSYNLYK